MRLYEGVQVTPAAWIAALAAAFAAIAFLVLWGLCRAAARGDRMAEITQAYLDEAGVLDKYAGTPDEDPCNRCGRTGLPVRKERMKNIVTYPSCGTFKVVRVDGTEEVMGPVNLSAIHKAIGCTCCDTVILKRSAFEAEIVMMVDDTGMIDGKPINPKATALYHGVRGPGTPYSIHGDVAIVNDEDFA